MPHLLRQLTAAFLVRDLRLDWRWGAEWFESRLVDYTPDANWGNWGYVGFALALSVTFEPSAHTWHTIQVGRAAPVHAIPTLTATATTTENSSIGTAFYQFLRFCLSSRLTLRASRSCHGQ